MTRACDACSGTVEIIKDNGADYPETRWEVYECVACGHRQSEVLTA